MDLLGAVEPRSHEHRLRTRFQGVVAVDGRQEIEFVAFELRAAVDRGHFHAPVQVWPRRAAHCECLALSDRGPRHSCPGLRLRPGCAVVAPLQREVRSTAVEGAPHADRDGLDLGNADLLDRGGPRQAGAVQRGPCRYIAVVEVLEIDQVAGSKGAVAYAVPPH